MAKRFFYVSFGILCLVAAYQLGAEQARADDDSLASFVVAGVEDLFWTKDGDAWEFEVQHIAYWQRAAEKLDLPVDPSQVAVITSNGPWFRLVTKSGEGWHSRSDGSWSSIGVIPSGSPASSAD